MRTVSPFMDVEIEERRANLAHECGNAETRGNGCFIHGQESTHHMLRRSLATIDALRSDQPRDAMVITLRELMDRASRDAFDAFLVQRGLNLFALDESAEFTLTEKEYSDFAMRGDRA